MRQFEPGLDYAKQLDREDSFANMRNEFHIPTTASGEDEIYFCGHSLGLQPRRTEDHLSAELSKWRKLAVKGHFADHLPWLDYHKFLAEQAGELVGASKHEAVIMNTLTANLHFLMVSFYRPTQSKFKIMIEAQAFPSDYIAVESQVRFHGHDPKESIIFLEPRAGAKTLEPGDILETIDRHRHELALVLIPGVQYYTGQVFPMQDIAQACQRLEIPLGLDLAHAAGNIPMSLHDWGVDFAAWCNYKYLNSGPGAVAGAFIHERHHSNLELPRLVGWWAHEQSTRFQMKTEFTPIQSADGWQNSNPPITSLACIKASYDVFSQAGGVSALREKSTRLTSYMEYLIRSRLEDKVAIITPSEESQRGCQLSLEAKDESKAREVFDSLLDAGVTADWRHPNVIRVAPTPLYNRFLDVYRFVEMLEGQLR